VWMGKSVRFEPAQYSDFIVKSEPEGRDPDLHIDQGTDNVARLATAPQGRHRQHADEVIDACPKTLNLAGSRSSRIRCGLGALSPGMVPLRHLSIVYQDRSAAYPSGFRQQVTMNR
jgi:hypothetical protein